MGHYKNTHDDKIRRLIAETRKLEHAAHVNYEHEKARTLDDFKNESKKSNQYTSNIPYPDLKIEVLTKENDELKKKYSVLIKKTNVILDAYRELIKEKELFVKKKNKTDYRAKTISNVKKFIIEIVDDIIKWINS